MNVLHLATFLAQDFSGNIAEIITCNNERVKCLVRTFTNRSPRFALKVHDRSIPRVSELAFDLTVGVEMKYIDALPSEFFSVGQVYDDFPETHKEPSGLHLRNIVSTYIAYRELAILNIKCPVNLVKSHCAQCIIELRLESSVYRCFSLVSFAITRLIDCVITEEGHNAIEVVGVEGIPILPHHFNDLCGRLCLT